MITRKRKLRTDGSLWQHVRAAPVSCRALTRDAHADVLIIGAGITGAMVAEALAETGLDIIVVDRRKPTDGSTTASTALVQYEIDKPLIELTEQIGERDAVRAWRRSRLAVSSLHSFFRERKIDAQQRNSLYLAGNHLGARDLQREAQLRQAAGLESEFLDSAALRRRFGIVRNAGLLAFDNLAINPRATATKLLNRAKDLGMRLYAPAEIVALKRAGSSIEGTSRDGARIRARHVVLACGYEFPKIVPTQGHRVSTTWAFATAPQPRKLWPEQCLIWEASTPYLYMRTTPDGRVLCGGEDESTPGAVGDEALLERKIARLQKKLAKLFPKLDTAADFSWAASFGETATGLPIIGAIPGRPNCWAALGYGGNGITYSRIAAEIIRSELTGASDQDADLYAFKR